MDTTESPNGPRILTTIKRGPASLRKEAPDGFAGEFTTRFKTPTFPFYENFIPGNTALSTNNFPFCMSW